MSGTQTTLHQMPLNIMKLQSRRSLGVHGQGKHNPRNWVSTPPGVRNTATFVFLGAHIITSTTINYCELGIEEYFRALGGLFKGLQDQYKHALRRSSVYRVVTPHIIEPSPRVSAGDLHPLTHEESAKGFWSPENWCSFNNEVA